MEFHLSNNTGNYQLEPTLFHTNINPFTRSFDFALFECPIKNIPDLLLIKACLFH
jgi:hypothetical protein